MTTYSILVLAMHSIVSLSILFYRQLGKTYPVKVFSRYDLRRYMCLALVFCFSVTQAIPYGWTADATTTEDPTMTLVPVTEPDGTTTEEQEQTQQEPTSINSLMDDGGLSTSDESSFADGLEEGFDELDSKLDFSGLENLNLSGLNFTFDGELLRVQLFTSQLALRQTDTGLDQDLATPRPLLGDTNQDRLVNETDDASVRTIYDLAIKKIDLLTDAQKDILDFEKDGILNQADADELIRQMHLGDVNNDGKVTPEDGLLVSEHVNGTRRLTEDQAARADVNDDGKLQHIDGRIIASYYLEIVAVLPADIHYGDVNGNGAATPQDALDVYLHTLGEQELSEIAQIAADVNDDGEISIDDAFIIFAYFLGFVSLPHEGQAMTDEDLKPALIPFIQMLEESGLEFTPGIGDVNLDGQVTPQDALDVYLHALGFEELHEIGQTVADVSGDGNISAVDALIIFAAFLEHITLPYEGSVENDPVLLEMREELMPMVQAAIRQRVAPGDVNHNGSVTPQDALDVYRHVLGIAELDEIGQAVADVSNDGNISVVDALMIFASYMEYIELPQEGTVTMEDPRLAPVMPEFNAIAVSIGYPLAELGDVNGDGVLTPQDALDIFRYAAGLIELTPLQLIAADVNEDGAVHALDGRILAAFLYDTGVESLPSSLRYGDVDQSGQVTPGDALLVYEHFLGIETLSETAQIVADVNDDNQINDVDALIIFNHFLGIGELPSDIVDFNDSQLDQVRPEFLEMTAAIEPPDTPKNPSIGDIDGNGSITPNDSFLVTLYIQGLIDLHPIQVANADVNQDHQVTLLDAKLIHHTFLNEIDELPADFHYADFNQSGEVDFMDFNRILAHLKRMQLGPVHESMADVNDDSMIDFTDAKLVFFKAIGGDYGFPIQIEDVDIWEVLRQNPEYAGMFALPANGTWDSFYPRSYFDANRDGAVDAQDFDPDMDHNGDGIINEADFKIILPEPEPEPEPGPDPEFEAAKKELLEKIDHTIAAAEGNLAAYRTELAEIEARLRAQIEQIEGQAGALSEGLKGIIGELEKLSAENGVSDATRENIQRFISEMTEYLESGLVSDLERFAEVLLLHGLAPVQAKITIEEGYITELREYRIKVEAAEDWDTLNGLIEKFPVRRPGDIFLPAIPMLAPPTLRLEAMITEGKTLVGQAVKEINESQFRTIQAAILSDLASTFGIEGAQNGYDQGAIEIKLDSDLTAAMVSFSEELAGIGTQKSLIDPLGTFVIPAAIQYKLNSENKISAATIEYPPAFMLDKEIAPLEDASVSILGLPDVRRVITKIEAAYDTAGRLAAARHYAQEQVNCIQAPCPALDILVKEVKIRRTEPSCTGEGVDRVCTQVMPSLQADIFYRPAVGEIAKRTVHYNLWQRNDMGRGDISSIQEFRVLARNADSTVNTVNYELLVTNELFYESLITLHHPYRLVRMDRFNTAEDGARNLLSTIHMTGDHTAQIKTANGITQDLNFKDTEDLLRQAKRIENRVPEPIILVEEERLQKILSSISIHMDRLISRRFSSLRGRAANSLSDRLSNALVGLRINAGENNSGDSASLPESLPQTEEPEKLPEEPTKETEPAPEQPAISGTVSDLTESSEDPDSSSQENQATGPEAESQGDADENRGIFSGFHHPLQYAMIRQELHTAPSLSSNVSNRQKLRELRQAIRIGKLKSLSEKLMQRWAL